MGRKLQRVNDSQESNRCKWNIVVSPCQVHFPSPHATKQNKKKEEKRDKCKMLAKTPSGKSLMWGYYSMLIVTSFVSCCLLLFYFLVGWGNNILKDWSYPKLFFGDLWLLSSREPSYRKSEATIKDCYRLLWI